MGMLLHSPRDVVSSINTGPCAVPKNTPQTSPSVRTAGLECVWCHCRRLHIRTHVGLVAGELNWVFDSQYLALAEVSRPLHMRCLGRAAVDVFALQIAIYHISSGLLIVLSAGCLYNPVNNELLKIFIQLTQL